jgi:hypothetical protein
MNWSKRAFVNDATMGSKSSRSTMLKLAFAELYGAIKSRAGFLLALIKAVPYTIHTVLIYNGIQFGDMPSRCPSPTAYYRLTCSTVAAARMASSTGSPSRSDRRPSRADEPQPQGSHCRAIPLHTHRPLRGYLEAFLSAYNFANLKTLGGLTPTRHLQSLGRTAKPIQL